MRKKPLFLILIVLATALTASAQTSTGTTPPIANTHGMSWNASDWNLPPAVIRYLKKHPKIAQKVLKYYNEHGEWPPFPQTTTPSAQVQMATGVQWPTAPPPPAAVPVIAGTK